MQIDVNITGQRIKTAREHKGLTQEQLSAALGRDKQTVWRWENGKRGLTFKTADSVAKALDVDVLYLLGYADDLSCQYDENRQSLRYNSTKPKFCDNLRNVRNQRGLTNEQLSEMSGIAINEINEMLASRNIPPAESTKKIAEALNVSVDRLMGLEGDGEQKADKTGIRDFHLWDDIPPDLPVKLAQQMLAVDPFLSLHLRDIEFTNAQARFIAAAVRLAIEKTSDTTAAM